METVFKWPKKKLYIQFDKTSGDFDESELNADDKKDFNIETGLTARQ